FQQTAGASPLTRLKSLRITMLQHQQFDLQLVTVTHSGGIRSAQIRSNPGCAQTFGHGESAIERTLRVNQLALLNMCPRYSGKNAGFENAVSAGIGKRPR